MADETATTAALLSRLRAATAAPAAPAVALAARALGAGAEIKPHTAPMNLRLRVHVPLAVPEGDVGMRLAGEALAWRRAGDA